MDVTESYVREQHDHYLRPMENLLCRLNSQASSQVEFHPAFTPALRVGSSLDVGYKLHDKASGPHRILELLVGESEYVKDPSGQWDFSSEALHLMKSEIKQFFSGASSDSYRIKSIQAAIP